MIYLLIAIVLFYLLGIIFIRKDRRQFRENIQTMEANKSTAFKQMRFLKGMVISSYIMEVVIWFYIGLLTCIILEYFNAI